MLSGSELEALLGWTQWREGRPWLVLRAPGGGGLSVTPTGYSGCSLNMAELVSGAVGHSRGGLDPGGLGTFQPFQIALEGLRTE